MINKSTVLVLGAGASIPYGYPSGRALVENIITNLSVVDAGPYQELLEAGFGSNAISNLRLTLMRSGHASIDAFLEHRVDLMEVGKAAIAQVIIGFEKNVDSDLQLFNRSDNKWYHQLKAALMAPRNIFPDNHLSVVTFNYDRSLEQYLYHSLLASWQCEEKEVVEALRYIRIIHVHGKLGNLPWESKGYSREYGFKKNSRELRESGNLIKIVHEGVAENSEFRDARFLIREAERILFLGFGYHDTNLARLGIREIDYNHAGRVVQGTRAGLTDLEVERIAGKYDALRNLKSTAQYEIHDFLRQKVILND